MVKDYYSILGVSKNSSQEEIKKAFRQAAKQYHPDMNANSASSEAKFKEINEAYNILGDPDRKAIYDRGGEVSDDFINPFSGGGGDSFEEIFSNFAGFPFFQNNKPEKVISVVLSFLEPKQDCKKLVSYERRVSCTTCHGSGGSSTQTCSPCHGTGNVFLTQGFMRIQTTCLSCYGKKVKILQVCNSCSGNGHIFKKAQLEVTIPAGVDHGSVLRIPGQGDDLGNGPGDLILQINVPSHEEWERRGADVISKISISYPQAVLGSQVSVNTIWGKEMLHIPNGCQPNSVISLPRQGFPHVNRVLSDTFQERGAHHFYIQLNIPTQISEEYKKCLEQLAKL